MHTTRGQEPLFTSRRDWAPVLARLRSTPTGEPPLTATARHLVEEFARERPGQRPDYKKNTRTLTILLYWLGADTAVFERDVYDLAGIDVNLAAKPVCQFLRMRGLLVEDHDCTGTRIRRGSRRPWPRCRSRSRAKCAPGSRSCANRVPARASRAGTTVSAATSPTSSPPSPPGPRPPTSPH
ncbi:hypothetical protein SMALB_7490 [Streptomyces malaysiensis]|uniref:Uncharacterized protein n=1 Tax=Streptomyces malaysiensis TaxID=92644 RepID=A0A7X5XBE1_STRMQ|nr:hypothetical protein [Streptomyces malaysiensis]